MNIASLYSQVRVDPSSVIGEYCVLGYPKEERLQAEQHKPGSAQIGEPVTVGPDCLVANHIVVYEGVRIGAGCVIEDRVRIGYNSTVGERARVVYGAYVCDRVTIGADACVAGFIVTARLSGIAPPLWVRLASKHSIPNRSGSLRCSRWGTDRDMPSRSCRSSHVTPHKRLIAAFWTRWTPSPTGSCMTKAVLRRSLTFLTKSPGDERIPST